MGTNAGGLSGLRNLFENRVVRSAYRGRQHACKQLTTHARIQDRKTACMHADK